MVIERFAVKGEVWPFYERLPEKGLQLRKSQKPPLKSPALRGVSISAHF